jgi:DNA (cytosine-5)-methyltransferase 1
MKKLLDLFAGAGGCSVGYQQAGFKVIGVDITEQINYPFELIVSDVFDFSEDFFDEFDVIHASPPCQAYSWSTKGIRNKGKEYPDLLGKTRDLLNKTGKEYIIENVPGAPLISPLLLCGTMFNLRVIRHRKFEINSEKPMYAPCKCNHIGSVNRGDYVSIYDGGKWIGKWGFSSVKERIDQEKEIKAKVREKYLNPDGSVKPRYCTVAGHGGDGSARYLDWCDAMDIHWMNKHKTVTKNKYDLTQAIPPAYTKWLGKLIKEV